MEGKSDDPRKALIATLCIDVARSTATGLQMRQNQRFQFQRAIIEIVDRYLQALDFHEIYSSFGGDGWLLFAPDIRDWPALVILAKTLCHRYPQDVFEVMSIRPEELPGIRTCICTGYDMQVSLFKQKDGTAPTSWIGDSARRASRFASCPREGELFVDQAIYDLINLQFDLSLVNLSKLPSSRKPKLNEETRPLWSVGDIKANAVTDAEAPAPYLHYLSWTGRNSQSERLASRIHERVSEEAEGSAEYDEKAQKQAVVSRLRSLLSAAPSNDLRNSLANLLAELGSAPTASFYNKCIDNAVSYPEAKGWYEAMREADVAPDAFTFNKLISIAPDYPSAVGWYDTMREAGVAPDMPTFDTLVSIAPDYASAVGWCDAMREAGVAPGAFMFNALISKAPDYASAVGWYDAMREAGVAPGAFTFNALISNAPDYPSAVGWYDAMRGAGVAPSAFTFNALISNAPDFRAAISSYAAMRDVGVAPDEFTTTSLAIRAPNFAAAQSLTDRLRTHGAFRGQAYYSAVFSKVPADADPHEIIDWYFQQDFRHPPSLEPVLGIFRRCRRFDAAMEIVVRWPQLPASMRFMKDLSAEFMESITGFLADPEMAPNARYALGIFHYYRGEMDRARAALEQAIKFPTSQGRRAHIARMLKKIASRG